MVHELVPIPTRRRRGRNPRSHQRIPLCLHPAFGETIPPAQSNRAGESCCDHYRACQEPAWRSEPAGQSRVLLPWGIREEGRGELECDWRLGSEEVGGWGTSSGWCLKGLGIRRHRNRQRKSKNRDEIALNTRVYHSTRLSKTRVKPTSVRRKINRWDPRSRISRFQSLLECRLLY